MTIWLVRFLYYTKCAPFSTRFFVHYVSFYLYIYKFLQSYTFSDKKIHIFHKLQKHNYFTHKTACV